MILFAIIITSIVVSVPLTFLGIERRWPAYLTFVIATLASVGVNLVWLSVSGAVL